MKVEKRGRPEEQELGREQLGEQGPGRVRPAEDKEVMELAIGAGHLLLENGAEIFRVEETMDRICRHYGVESGNAFVLSNGIFATAGDEREGFFAKVQHIPVSGAHLDKVAAVNQLSREISQGKYTAAEALKALEAIKAMPGKRKISQIVASGVGSGAFCYLFGGTLFDGLCALAAGALLYLFVLYVSGPSLSRIVGNILGGALVTLVCSGLYLLRRGGQLDYMIIGSIMPLIPGVPFTNAIRDIADGDYISGSVRMLDALLVFFSIAIGVGMAYSLMMGLLGGDVL